MEALSEEPFPNIIEPLCSLAPWKEGLANLTAADEAEGFAGGVHFSKILGDLGVDFGFEDGHVETHGGNNF